MSKHEIKPKTDPRLGTWTPGVLVYNLTHLNDEDFNTLYGKSKDRVCEIAQLPSTSDYNYIGDAVDAVVENQAESTVEAEPEEGVEPEPEAEADEKNQNKVYDAETDSHIEPEEPLKDNGEPIDKVESDPKVIGGFPIDEIRKDMDDLHHQQFKKKYGSTQKEFRKIHNLEEAD